MILLYSTNMTNFIVTTTIFNPSIAVKKLSKIDNIIGVKDATNDLFRPLLTLANMKNDFCFLSGEDGTALAFLAQGGHGCISVTANVAPRLCSDLHEAWREKI